MRRVGRTVPNLGDKLRTAAARSRATAAVDALEDALRAAGIGNAVSDGDQIGIVIHKVARAPVWVELRDVVVGARSLIRPEIRIHSSGDARGELPQSRRAGGVAQRVLGLRELVQKADDHRVRVAGEVVADEDVNHE